MDRFLWPVQDTLRAMLSPMSHALRYSLALADRNRLLLFAVRRDSASDRNRKTKADGALNAAGSSGLLYVVGAVCRGLAAERAAAPRAWELAVCAAVGSNGCRCRSIAPLGVLWCGRLCGRDQGWQFVTDLSWPVAVIDRLGGDLARWCHRPVHAYPRRGFYFFAIREIRTPCRYWSR